MPCEGLGDCVKYMAMSEAFRSGSFGAIDSPFNTRVLAPWLSSLLPVTVTQGFLITNAIASLVFVVAWHGISRALGLRNVEFAALLAWFFLHPLGFALYHAMPGSVDPLAHAMLGLTTWAYLRRHASLPALLLLGLLAKESFSFVCLIIIAAELVRMRLSPSHELTRSSPKVMLGYAIGALLTYKLLQIGIEHWLFPPTNGFTLKASDTVHHFWKEVKRHPDRLLVWLTSIVCVTGAFPALLARLWNIHRTGDQISATVYLTLGATGFILLGLLGGSDMSRIIFTGNLLVIGAMLYPMGGRLPGAWSTALTTALSLVIALHYTRMLPATLEYDYYLNNQRLGPTTTVLAAGLLVLAVSFVLNGLLARRAATPQP